MSEKSKIKKIIGGIFLVAATVCFLVSMVLFVFVDSILKVIPAVFVLILGLAGIELLMSAEKGQAKQNNILTYGQHYLGKIVGHIEDGGEPVDGQHFLNTRVRYFDASGRIREVVVDTGTRGKGNDFPEGATIEIAVLENMVTWIKGSVSQEHIPDEEELMDGRPLSPIKSEKMAVSCQGCGASFYGDLGYLDRCPYCNELIKS